MQVSRSEIISFQKKIFQWWKTHKRDLPWRHTHDPYKILVSEVMLQQTQVSRVTPKYPEFIKLYPKVTDLAKAPLADVIRIWKGMGYNRRALYLHKLAKIIVDQHNGQFPISEQLLSKLPGVGTYTARAIMVFAFGKNIAMVDTNIRKIITHYFFNDTPRKPSDIQRVADQLLPAGKSWHWHQALMDYGALVMSKMNRSKRRDAQSGASQALMDYGALALQIPRITHNSSRVPQKPFKESDRYLRGRIIDVLREGECGEKNLVRIISHMTARTSKKVKTVINVLEQEGLLIKKKGFLALPG
jgi:A/G-specific adenine glycosylase